jgi:hypothetical protein
LRYAANVETLKITGTYAGHGHRMIAYEDNVNANLIIPIDAAMAVDSRAQPRRV